jgi:pimeloyl-ACP methyl ester carboxylesterase
MEEKERPNRFFIYIKIEKKHAYYNYNCNGGKKMPYIFVEDFIRLYYEDEGSGKPLIFVHPPGMGSITFSNQKNLAEHFRIITYDMRGNGKSSPSNKPITIELLADDIKMLLDNLHIDKAVICGYSNGGSIALEFSLSYPERVEKLILIGGFSEVCTTLLHWEFLLGIYTVKNHGIPLLAKVLGLAHGKHYAEKKAIEQYVRLTNERDLYQMYTEGLRYNCTERLSQLKIPLLLIYGARDYYVHYYKNIFKKYVPYTDIIYISKAKHQIPTKYYNELNAIIKAYCLT